MNHQQAMLALDDFFLGAAMKSSPCLDDFGGQDEPDEPMERERGFVKEPDPIKETKTFEDYVKVYCGDRKLAMYWYLKHNPQK